MGISDLFYRKNCTLAVYLIVVSWAQVIDTIVFVGLKWYLGVYPSANAWAKSQPENNVMENKHYIPMENAS